MSLDAAIYNEARLARKFSEVVGSRRQLILRRVVTSSEVLTLPAGYYDIIAIGTGGSGGRAFGTNFRATGGGGPAWARDWGKFAAPTPVRITIGARALGVPTGNTNVDGNAGGTTSVTGIANPITLTGAQGGVAGVAGTTISGGAGGTASGGRIRANGGRGGNITTTSADIKATGGGAVDLFLLGADRTRGGDISSTSTASLASGGAGVGGRGGDATGTTTDSTVGGGAGGDANDNWSASAACGPALNGVRGSGIAPTDLEVADVLLAYPGLYPVGSGSNASAAPASGGGGGGSGGTSVTTVFGGSGGSVNNSSASSGESVRGGGSGGAAAVSGTPSTGHGGAAVCIVSVYAEVA